MNDARKCAAEVLGKCLSAGQYSNIALDHAIGRSGLSDADKGLLTVLVYGVLEKQITLDHQIENLSDRKLSDVAPEILVLLRLGIYQLAYLDRVPDHAAVNETVELAPKHAKGFVNAVLRAFLRNGKQITFPPQGDIVRYLSVRYSFGEPLCERLIAEFGAERAERLMIAYGENPPVTLRVNSFVNTREELLTRFAGAGIDAGKTELAPYGIRVTGTPVTALPGFDGGAFFVQDESSQLCVEALDAKEGMNVLDVCACPGSKTFGAAINMKNSGKVVACDLHRNKLSLVESGAKRLGITIVTVEERDARERKEEWKNGFDRVLCDVPCSGFGVFAKKPELRYKDPETSKDLPGIQYAILQNASAYVKKDGKLVYSTCTVLDAENGANIRRFLENNKNFSLLCERSLYPDTDGTDGFYYAVLVRNA